MTHQPNPAAVARLAHITQLIRGLPIAVAEVKAREAGYEIRVMDEDDQRFVGTCDYRTDRINVSVENGTVVAISSIS